MGVFLVGHSEDLTGARVSPPRLEEPRPTIVFTLPVLTTNPLNGSRGNSRIAHVIRARERAKHVEAARLFTRATMMRMRVSPVDLVPCVVRLARLSAGKMDDDGLAASQKGVRDGIAQALGVDDGSAAIRFEYSQVKVKPRVYGVHVTIERRAT